MLRSVLLEIARYRPFTRRPDAIIDENDETCRKIGFRFPPPPAPGIVVCRHRLLTDLISRTVLTCKTIRAISSSDGRYRPVSKLVFFPHYTTSRARLGMILRIIKGYACFRNHHSFRDTFHFYSIIFQKLLRNKVIVVLFASWLWNRDIHILVVSRCFFF